MNQEVRLTFSREEFRLIVESLEEEHSRLAERCEQWPRQAALNAILDRLVPLLNRLNREQTGEPLTEPEKYERELRQRAGAKYPNPSPELAARIEEKIRRMVGERIDEINAWKVQTAAARGVSREELNVLEYEKYLRTVVAEKYGKEPPERLALYHARVSEMVEEYRQAQGRQQQQQTRTQGPGRGLSL